MPDMARLVNRYSVRFDGSRVKGKKALMPFTLLGWPNLDASFEIIQTLIDSGATALELGIPFSDPMADGPIIQAAAKEALENGFSVDRGFELLKKVRVLDAEIPIGLLVYYNLVLARGVERFFADMAESGVDGLLIADLPPEQVQEVAPMAQKYNIQLIFIVSPLTSDARLALILKYAGGFHYVVSRLGITGVEDRYDAALAELITRLKAKSDLPVFVGFGISKPTHVRQMITLGADGVITGSAVIQKARENSGLAEFIQEMLDTAVSLP